MNSHDNRYLLHFAIWWKIIVKYCQLVSRAAKELYFWIDFVVKVSPLNTFESLRWDLSRTNNNSVVTPAQALSTLYFFIFYHVYGMYLLDYIRKFLKPFDVNARLCTSGY